MEFLFAFLTLSSFCIGRICSNQRQHIACYFLNFFITYLFILFYIIRLYIPLKGYVFNIILKLLFFIDFLPSL